MIIEKVVVGEAQTNCYILGCGKTKEAIIIDPGADKDKIIEKIKSLNLTPKYIVLTHAHGDHIGAVLGSKKYFNVPVYIHHMDLNMLGNADLNYSEMILGKPIAIKTDMVLNDTDILKLGSLEIEVIHTPGHTGGSISLKCGAVIFCGDTLFKDSIGRTDLIGGSYNKLINSIINRLLVYPEETVIYPGHGPVTTIGYERNHNIYLQ